MDTPKRSRPSRRIAQRSLKRRKTKQILSNKRDVEKQNDAIVRNEKDVIIGTKLAIESVKRNCIKDFGYVADPYLPKWRNMENAISHMTPADYFNRPNQMAYHDLCRTKKPPDGIGSTLGLGLKFCVQSDQPPNNLKTSYTRFANDVRTKLIFAGCPPKDTPKKIYVKSKDWLPDTAEEHVEKRIITFCKAIAAESNFLRCTQKKSSNLTILQKSHLNTLRSNRDFVILNADKNLGPAIMEREEYLKTVLQEHLLD